MESIMMYADESGLEKLPGFISSSQEYLMEYEVLDVKNRGFGRK